MPVTESFGTLGAKTRGATDDAGTPDAGSVVRVADGGGLFSTVGPPRVSRGTRTAATSASTGKRNSKRVVSKSADDERMARTAPDGAGAHACGRSTFTRSKLSLPPQPVGTQRATIPIEATAAPRITAKRITNSLTHTRDKIEATLRSNRVTTTSDFTSLFCKG